MYVHPEKAEDKLEGNERRLTPTICTRAVEAKLSAATDCVRVSAVRESTPFLHGRVHRHNNLGRKCGYPSPR